MLHAGPCGPVSFLGFPYETASLRAISLPASHLSSPSTHPSQAIIVFLFTAPTQHDRNNLWQGLDLDRNALAHSLLFV